MVALTMGSVSVSRQGVRAAREVVAPSAGKSGHDIEAEGRNSIWSAAPASPCSGFVKESAYREHYEVEDRHWWYRGRWAVVEALLSQADLPPRPRILDAGCGTGGNLRKF